MFFFLKIISFHSSPKIFLNHINILRSSWNFLWLFLKLSQTFVIVFSDLFFFYFQTCRPTKGAGSFGAKITSYVGDGMAINRRSTVPWLGALHDSHAWATYSPVSAPIEQNRIKLNSMWLYLFLSLINSIIRNFKS